MGLRHEGVKGVGSAAGALTTCIAETGATYYMVIAGRRTDIHACLYRKSGQTVRRASLLSSKTRPQATATIFSWLVSVTCASSPQRYRGFKAIPAPPGATPAALFHGLSQKVLLRAPAGQLCFARKSHSLYKIKRGEAPTATRSRKGLYGICTGVGLSA